MGLRSWVKKKARKAKRTIEKKVAKPVKKVADKSIDEIERAARNASNSVEREIMGIIDDVKRLASRAKKEVEDVANKAEREVADTASKAVREVQEVAEKAEREVERIPAEVEKAITEQLPKEIEKGFQTFIDELAKAVTKEGLTTLRAIVHAADRDLTKFKENKPELTDEINNLGFSMEIGPVTLAYSGFYDRIDDIAEVLDTYVNHPPELRRKPIIQMIEALGPDTVDLGASVQVVALVVGSKELGIGGSLDSVGIGLFSEIGDVILEEIGIPE